METLIIFAIPGFVLLMLLEWAFSYYRQKPVYEWRDTMANLAMGLGNLLINLLLGAAVLGLYALCYQYRLYEFPATAISSWIVLLFAEDFCYYWFHRVHHESRIGWAGHVNHHSSTHYNLSVALRQSWTTHFTGVIFWVPLAFAGFHPLMIITQQAISLTYQFWIHTETIGRLGPLESVLNTPSHHRVHHGSNAQYIDKNYAGIFIIWDRLLGTFAPEQEPVNYGITKNINTYNPVKIAFHEWQSLWRDARSAKSLCIALNYVFRHPGWQPEDRIQPKKGPWTDSRL